MEIHGSTIPTIPGNRNMKIKYRIMVTGIGNVIFALFVISVLWINSVKLEVCENCMKIYDSEEIGSPKMRSNQGCSEAACVVTCRELQASVSVEKEIQNILSQSSCASIILKILNTNFPNNKIEANWLSSLTVTIKQLEIKSSTVSQIEDDAFASSVFESLETLTMEGNNIKYLQKNALRHLNLISFEFRFTAFAKVNFEAGLLEHVSSTLQILQFNYCLMDSETLANITGTPGVTLSSLQTLDLRFNALKSIGNGSIVNTPNLIQIFLNENSLANVDVDAFSKLSRLERMYFDVNLLEGLPEGVFRKFHGDLYLESNPWVCDCNLQWLKDSYLEKIKDVPTCDNHDDENFESVEFCSTVGETTTKTSDISTTYVPATDMSTTDISTTDMATTESSIYTKILCRNGSTSPNDLPTNTVKDHVQSDRLQIKDTDLSFHFSESEQPFYVEVEIEGNIAGFHILWFNSYNISDYGCITNLESTIVFDGMKRNETYTICLLCETDPTLLPQNCLDLTTRVEYPYRAWIQNRSKDSVISISVAVLCTTAILSAGIMFFCVWRCPSCLKYNKRVIIVGKQTVAKRQTCKEYEQSNYEVPSLDLYSRGSYLTANSYARVRYPNYRAPILEPVLENVPMTPNTFQAWRIYNHQKRRFQDIHGVRNADYEMPPPLPPLNNSDESGNRHDHLYSMI